MEWIKTTLKSRQFWTLIVLFVINGVGAVREFIPATALPAVDAALTLLAVYFRVKPKQDYK